MSICETSKQLEAEAPASVNVAWEIGKLYRRGIEAWIAVGERLLDEKKQMPPGEWTRWLHDNRDVLGFSERTAQRFMALAEDPTLTSEALWGNKRRISKSGKGNADPKNNGSSVINDDRSNSNSIAPCPDAERKAQFLSNAVASVEAARFDGPVDNDIVAAASCVSTPGQSSRTTWKRGVATPLSPPPRRATLMPRTRNLTGLPFRLMARSPTS
jgi:hypothetical protein